MHSKKPSIAGRLRRLTRICYEVALSRPAIEGFLRSYQVYRTRYFTTASPSFGTFTGK